MHLLILQLSDIHIRDASDPILGRSVAILDAIKTLDFDLDCVLLALTGDIAFSGIDAQYECATTFLNEITSQLPQKLESATIPIWIAAIPGNHDCALTGHTT